MNALQTFAFRDNSVRIITLDGEPWFVAADVCRCLGYAMRANGTINVSNIRDALREDEVITSLTGNKGRPSLCVSESGLYKLIMRSDKPEARAFQDWVTREVLPAIRKDGAYIAGQEKVRSGEMDEDAFVLKAMEILNRKVQRLQEERDKLAARHPSRCRLLEVYGGGAG